MPKTAFQRCEEELNRWLKVLFSLMMPEVINDGWQCEQGHYD
jgi:hypothetical protein